MNCSFRLILLQIPSNLYFYLEFANIYAQFNINDLAEVEIKKGVELDFEIEIKGKEACEEFHELMLVTGERDNFATRGTSYFERIMDALSQFYFVMVDEGMSKEDSRLILPNACCTNLVMTMNARSLLNFFAHRCCVRAQWEIRELANEMLKLVKEVAPVIFENAGASCVQKGYCPEGKKGCGKVPTIQELTEFYEYGKNKGLRE